jgi:hypothetical protein
MFLPFNASDSRMAARIIDSAFSLLAASVSLEGLAHALKVLSQSLAILSFLLA